MLTAILNIRILSLKSYDQLKEKFIDMCHYPVGKISWYEALSSMQNVV